MTLLEAAALELQRQGDDPREGTIRVDIQGPRGLRLHLEGQVSELPQAVSATPNVALPAPPRSGQGRWLSPTEEAIVGALTSDWQTGQQIAERAGLSRSSFFNAVLSNLAEREVIESSRSGYRRLS
jgi:hypothetical protein